MSAPDHRRPQSNFADEPTLDHGGAIADLGLLTEQIGETVVGRAELAPEMCVPGTDIVRTSVLVAWADTVTGLLAGISVHPTITVTLDLELSLYRPVVAGGEITLVATTAKTGRQVTITRVVVTDVDGPAATGVASFVASPKPEHIAPPGGFLSDRPTLRRRLDRPFAERALVRHDGVGVAEVPWTTDNLNATSSINGGLLALVAEEAVLSAAPGSMLMTMSLRYLRAFRTGPARATATVRDGVATVDVIEGVGGRLGALATARLGALATARLGP